VVPGRRLNDPALAIVARQQHHEGKPLLPWRTGTAPHIDTFARRHLGGPDHGCNTRHLDRSFVRGITDMAVQRFRQGAV
jgi:hypothetical protein